MAEILLKVSWHDFKNFALRISPKAWLLPSNGLVKMGRKWKIDELECLERSRIFSQALNIKSWKLSSSTIFTSSFDWQSQIFEKNHPWLAAKVSTRNYVFFAQVSFQFFNFFTKTVIETSPTFIFTYRDWRGLSNQIFNFFLSWRFSTVGSIYKNTLTIFNTVFLIWKWLPHYYRQFRMGSI